jgi:hypothetical protein
MRRSARWVTVTAGLLVAASASPSARAADDKATREAEARFAEGLSRVKRQDYEAARLSFEQAYAVLHRPLILWNLALADEKSGHPLEALTNFRKVSHEAASEADRASAQKHVDALLAQLSRIDAQAPSGTAFVLDGADVGATAPLADPLDVAVGHHVVVARMSGGVSKTSEVDTVAGHVAHVAFVADAPAPVAAVAPVAAPAEAQAPPPAPVDQAPTDHPFWTPRTITAVTLGSAAVVAVGFGAVFGVESQHNKSQVGTFMAKYGQDGCGVGSPANPDCATWNDAVNAQNRDANISNALYFTGGVFALGAVVSWFFWPKHGHGAAAWVMPEVGPGRAGVGAGGHF